MKKVELSSMVFGRLTVMGDSGKRTRKQERLWECRCECGNTTLVDTTHLCSGNTKSCGCLRKDKFRKTITKHGKRYTKIYDVWKTMKQRCDNGNSNSYKYYGGKGVTYCERWKEFPNFFADMGESYDEMREKLKNNKKRFISLDRIDNNGNYEPSNCRWASYVTQNTNK